MKSFILAVLVIVSAFAKAYSQDLQGIATYQTQRHVEMKMDSTSGMNSEMQKSIQEQLRKQFQKEYKLTFNGPESLWKEDATLEKPEAPMGDGIQIRIQQSNDELYTNIDTAVYTEQSDLMGKQFLVEDTLKTRDWVLVKEIKNIGQYTCFKATLTEEVDTHTFMDGEEEAKKETKVTTAWYTLDIPVKHGPDTFWGLPGLILEVNDGNMAMMCTKVVLNPKEGVTINPPTKGKKVNAQQYKEISDEKTKEMMERYSTPSKKNGGSHMIIKMGGN